MFKRQRLSLLSLLTAAFCAPSALAQSGATKPERRDEVPRAFTMIFGGDNYLGVYTEPVTRENQARYQLSGVPRGVAVTEVIENSPAAKAGLQKGDVILAFDGEQVTSTPKLVRLVNESAPEHLARLTIWRAGSERELSVTLGRREAADGKGALELANGRLFRRNDDQWKKQAEEWRKNSEEWKKQGEEMKRRAEELRKQFGNLPRSENFNFGYVLGASRRIGVTTMPLTEQLADFFGVQERAGLLVTFVAERSPAAKAGLKAGDVITEAEGEKVKSTIDLSRAINRKDEGEVTLTVVRERSRRTFRLTPEKTTNTFTLPGAAPRELFALPDSAVALPRFSMTTPHVFVPRVVFLPARPRLVPVVLPRLTTPRLVAACPA